MSEWTPGPWVIEKTTAHQQGYVGIGSTAGKYAWSGFAEVVTHMDGAADEYPEGVANAHLIAAAPDLYEALRRLEKNGHTQATWDFALKAMAKARGEAQ